MSNPVSAPQPLREQMLSDATDLDACCERPGGDCVGCVYCDAAKTLRQAADRLASLEQRNADLEQWQQSAEAIAREFMDDGSSFGPDEYRTVSIGDVAALVLPFQAQVASLEQAQQALRALLKCPENDGTHYCPNCDRSLFVAGPDHATSDSDLSRLRAQIQQQVHDAFLEGFFAAENMNGVLAGEDAWEQSVAKDALSTILTSQEKPKFLQAAEARAAELGTTAADVLKSDIEDLLSDDDSENAGHNQ